MKKIIVLILIAMLCLAGCTAGSGTQTGTVFAMDTVITYTAYGAGGGLADYTEGIIENFENTFSVNIASSDVAKINSNSGSAVEVSAEVIEVIRTANEVSRRSGGAFDVTIYPLIRAWGFTGENTRVPSDIELLELLPLVDYTAVSVSGDTVGLELRMGIDLGGVAKGYIAQRICEAWQSEGITGGMVSVGGNIQVTGQKPDGTPWNIGIQDPFSPDDATALIGVLSIDSGAVVTSGDYRRYAVIDGVTYHHILNPFTGYPADSGVKSVSIICENGALADALSTALFVLGEEGAADYYWQYGGFDYIMVTTDGRVICTAGVAGRFEMNLRYAGVLSVLN